MEKLDTQRLSGDSLRAFSDNTNHTSLIDSIQSVPVNYDQNYKLHSKRLQKSLTDESDNSNVAALRLNFRKSHTCGSLFAKCNCSKTPSPSTSSLTKSLLAQSENFNNNKINDNNDNDTTNPTNIADDYLISRNGSKSYKQQFKVDSGARECNPLTNVINSSSVSDSDGRNTNSTRNLKSGDRARKLFQSYSHPDTTFIFTDENKNASANPLAVRNTSTTVTTKCGRVEIKHQKRLSSPNIGNYAILDVAVHPEVLLKISTKNATDTQTQNTEKISTSSSSSVKTVSNRKRRPILQRCGKQECSVSTDSENSVEILHDSVNNSMTYSASGSEPDSTATTTTSINSGSQDLQDFEDFVCDSYGYDKKLTENIKSNENLEYLKYNAIGHQQLSESEKQLDPAQKFFQESGILGPIGINSSNLIRKTSKIMQDPNVIEKIRKNSKLLLRNSSENRSKGHGGATNDELEHIRTITTNMKVDHTRDDKIKSLQDEVSTLRDLIKNRDSEICKLKREIHKLKSVLQQTTNHMPMARGDLLSNFQAHHGMAAGQQQLFQAIPATGNSSNNNEFIISNTNNNNNSDISTVVNHNQIQYHDTCNNTGPGSLLNDYECKQIATAMMTPVASVCSTGSIITSVDVVNSSLCGSDGSGRLSTAGASSLAVGGKPNQLHVQAPVLKKQGVSGESSDAANHQSNNIPIPKFEKDFRSKQLIKDAIMDNDFLKNIDSTQVRELVESMYSLEIAKGEYVIREGEVGSHLYVSAEGEFEVIKNGQTLGLMGPGKAFGELAILYNCTRTASIQVLCDARVWVLDRRVFQQIMMRTGMQRIEENVNFLKSVPLLKNLSNDVLTKIADVLEVEFYPAGTYIIRQGASGDSFFLISQGSVKVTQKLPNTIEEKEIRILERGDYFGEQALINEDKRTANIIALDPGVECLTLDRESFTHLIGDLCELKEKSYGDEGRILATKIEEEAKEVFGTNVVQELQDLKLDELEIVATLGIGGFGRVELVKCYRDNQVKTYALKCLKKKHITDTRQEEHVFSERTIMLSCNTPFICRLYRTFRDTKYVYMLLEACMGGEVWTILRDRGCFDENTTQFIIGCVLQAFEYLHSRGIIYRDLKPENLMLDERGYVKLVDFGFAKYIGHSNKTWTFCGTPEYVAPEIILNKGHDRAVDYWALGILIHELLNGTPPFSASDPMKTYNIILKGIDMIDFPKHMSRAATMLIKKLCRDVPAERLGYQKGGIQDIKKHKWFQGFDWDGLSNLTLIPPFLRPVSHALDTSYFDNFPVDTELPPDETSGWDADF